MFCNTLFTVLLTTKYNRRYNHDYSSNICLSSSVGTK